MAVLLMVVEVVVEVAVLLVEVELVVEVAVW